MLTFNTDLRVRRAMQECIARARTEHPADEDAACQRATELFAERHTDLVERYKVELFSDALAARIEATLEERVEAGELAKFVGPGGETYYGDPPQAGGTE
jgi:hypothetical protein